jgi:CDP-2,3-bis-(O-geranylgeranyl)-sn-glycerol synthase
MADEILAGAVLFLPVFLGFVLHGVCIRSGLGQVLARPLDRGATLRGRRLFGENKTWRGIACVGLGTALGFLGLASALGTGGGPHPHALPTGYRAFLLGLAVGVAAMLGELPNSALKRQLDIDPGAQALGLRGVVFHVLDQVDVVAGAWLVLGWFVVPRPTLVLGSLLFVYLGHQLVSFLGYVLGMRSTPR